MKEEKHDAMNIREVRQKQLDKYVKEARLTATDRKQFADFLAEKQAQNVSPSGLVNYAYVIYILSKHTDKNISALTKSELIDFVNQLSKKYSKSSVDVFKIALKTYLRHVHNGQQKEVYDWLKVKRSQDDMLPEAVLDEQDVRKMIEACDNDRDRVLISTLYESGARISEFLGMKMQHVQFIDNVMAKIYLNGKTGKRIVPVLLAEPALRNFYENHPNRDDPEAYLWIRKHGNKHAGNNGLLSSGRINDLLKRVAERAGIKKPIHCHSLRHARATELSKTMNEMALRQIFGWTRSSNMPSVYLHISQKDIERQMREDAGVPVEDAGEMPNEQKKNVLKPIKCPKCAARNPATRKFCIKCERCLDINTALQFDDQKTALLDALVTRIANDLRKNPQLIEHYLVSGEEIAKIKS